MLTLRCVETIRCGFRAPASFHHVPPPHVLQSQWQQVCGIDD